MPLPSAGLLVYRPGTGGLEVLLVHPGGPMWARRDAGAWSLPKGEYLADEEPLAAARREFAEELGLAPPDGGTVPLGTIRQRSGKVVIAWAVPGNLDVSTIISNTCTIVWPPRSGREIEIPEVDRAEYFPLAVAREKINAAQIPFLERLAFYIE